ncbi:MAG: DUF3078 domain-containing protein [Bacteroidota bacterium]|nr:DUF3078 domain-containing protein [Bacteroidota bacterium]
MKRFYLIALVFTIYINSQAFAGIPDESIIDTVKIQPKVRYWKFGGTTNMNFNQISFSNWVAGGENAFSGTAGFSPTAYYKKKNVTFDNSGIFSFGMIDSKDKGLMKMEDRLEINSKLNYQAVKFWNYSLFLNLKSQFAPGYNYPNRINEVSRFFAPGYLTLSLGMDYQPNPHLSLFMSPASGKFTFVLDQKLADAGAYGVRKAIKDSVGNIVFHGEPIKPELGLSFNAKVKYEIMKNIVLDSRLALYDNYMDEDVDNRWNMDVDFETNINFMINSIFSTTFNSRFLYDNNIMVPIYSMVDGKKVQIGQGPRLQAKQAFGIGMIMKLGANRKPR